MSELDKKLEHIFKPYFAAGNLHNSSALPKCVDEVKQAFKEAGYVRTVNHPDGSLTIHDIPVFAQPLKLLPRQMSGTDWYQRFEKELGKPQTFVGYGYDSTGYEDDDVLSAARRAAGIEE